jgi:hypothetical protein
MIVYVEFTFRDGGACAEILKGIKIKKLTIATALFVIGILPMQTQADTYDPSTNQLTIPTITVDGIIYTNVIITVGNILSIGGSTKSDDSGILRKCSWTFTGREGHDDIKYDLEVTDHGTIGVDLTGLTNVSFFNTIGVNLVQGENSTQVGFHENGSDTLWHSYDRFIGGTIPEGVKKSNLLYDFPSWFDLNLPFKWIEDRNEHTC